MRKAPTIDDPGFGVWSHETKRTLPTIMLSSPTSGLATIDSKKTATHCETRGHAVFATRSLVGANEAAVMRARLEAFVRPVTFAENRRVA